MFFTYICNNHQPFRRPPLSRKKALLIGTFILTLTGMVSRIIGFFYRIFLSHTIGAEQLGIFQLVSPVYSMALAVCSAGIQTSLSRFIAAKTAEKDKTSTLHFLVTGTVFSFLLALVSAFLLYYFSVPVGTVFLGEPRTIPLLQVMACSIPLSVIHSCIAGWYFGQNKTAVPSLCQLLEQTVRVLSSYLIYLIFLQEGRAPSALLAALGTLAGDVVSCLFSLIVIRLETSRLGYRIRTLTNPGNYLKQLLLLAYPLMANRIFMSLLHSLETILIPARLQAGGMNVSESLSIYGVLTGMTMPLIFFPSTITNSVSVMLMPDVARKQASGNRSSIAATISQTIRFCMILGIFSLGIFFFYGNSMGILLFRSQEAGNFLRTLAFLCPFLYLDSTLSSILTGLGKTKAVFVQNISGLGIRIAFVWFAVPSQGIKGYLSGLLASEILTTFLRLTSLYREVHFSFYAVPALLFPAGAMLTAAGCTFPVHHLLDTLGLPPLAVLFLDVGTAAFLYLFLLRPLLPSNSSAR